MTFPFPRALARVAVVVFVGLVAASPAFAVTKTWTNNNGTGDGKWGTAANWSPSGVPTSSDSVEIGVTDQTSNYLTVDTAAVAGSLTIGNVFTNNPTVEIKSGQTLTISSASSIDAGATVYLNNGNLAGAGALTVSGTVTVGGGTLGGSGGITVNSGGAINFSAISNYGTLSRNVTNSGTITYLSGAVYDY